MAKHKKRFSDRQLQERERIESELSQIKPMCELARKITTTDGFINYYLQMRELYSSYNEAYERLEDFHIAITGRRKYSEYNSFQVVSSRYLDSLHRKRGNVLTMFED